MRLADDARRHGLDAEGEEPDAPRHDNRNDGQQDEPKDTFAACFDGLRAREFAGDPWDALLQLAMRIAR